MVAAQDVLGLDVAVGVAAPVHVRHARRDVPAVPRAPHLAQGAVAPHEGVQAAVGDVFRDKIHKLQRVDYLYVLLHNLVC